MNHTLTLRVSIFKESVEIRVLAIIWLINVAQGCEELLQLSVEQEENYLKLNKSILLQLLFLR